MKIYITYFYKVRFFKPHMIPMSTAMFDPKWFHNFKGQQHVFVDKNGVINGLRADPFVPKPIENGCQKNCPQLPQSCNFLKYYRADLDKIELSNILDNFMRLGAKVQKELQFKEDPVIVLLVYETPTNPCSERQPIIDWFRSKGIEVTELLI